MLTPGRMGRFEKCWSQFRYLIAAYKLYSWPLAVLSQPNM